MWTLDCTNSLIVVKETPTGMHLLQAGRKAGSKKGEWQPWWGCLGPARGRLHPESPVPGDSRAAHNAGLERAWSVKATGAPHPSSSRSGTPWRTRTAARGQVRGGAGRAGRDQAGGGR